MMRVGHVLESYPLRELEFIHTQIVVNGGRSDIVLAESLMPPIAPAPTRAPVFGYRSSLATDSGPFSSHRGWERLHRKWLDTAGYRFHVRRLTESLLRVLREHPVEILHAHFGMAGAKAVSLKERARVPLVVTFYGMDASQCLRQPAWLRRYRRLFAAVDRVIVLSEEVSRRLAHHGCPRERIRVWDIGLDLSAFGHQARPAPGTRGGRFLCVARFAEKKGHPTLLRAFQQVAAARPDATLTLIGYGPLKAQIEHMAAALGVGDRVTIIDTAERSDFKPLFLDALRSQDVFVLASTVAKDGDDEGGPALTLVSAQATGLPVIATSFVGVERSVAHDVTGLLSQPDDPDDLAVQMEQMLAVPGLAERLGRAGAAFVHERFALERQLPKLEAIYRELL